MTLRILDFGIQYWLHSPFLKYVNPLQRCFCLLFLPPKWPLLLVEMFLLWPPPLANLPSHAAQRWRLFRFGHEGASVIQRLGCGTLAAMRGMRRPYRGRLSMSPCLALDLPCHSIASKDQRTLPGIWLTLQKNDLGAIKTSFKHPKRNILQNHKEGQTAFRNSYSRKQFLHPPPITSHRTDECRPCLEAKKSLPASDASDPGWKSVWTVRRKCSCHQPRREPNRHKKQYLNTSLFFYIWVMLLPHKRSSNSRKTGPHIALVAKVAFVLNRIQS